MQNAEWGAEMVESAEEQNRHDIEAATDANTPAEAASAQKDTYFFFSTTSGSFQAHQG